MANVSRSRVPVARITDHNYINSTPMAAKEVEVEPMEEGKRPKPRHDHTPLASPDAKKTKTKGDKEKVTEEITNATLLEAIQSLVDRFDKQDERLAALEDKLEAVNKSVHKTQEDIGHLQERIVDLQQENASLKKMCLEQARYKRRWDLRITGLTEKENENTREVVLGILTRVVPMSIEKLRDTVDTVHRIGRFSAATNRMPRPIIIHFAMRTVRDEVWKKSKEARVCREMNFQFKEDFCKEDREARAKLYPKVKEAKRLGKKAFLKEGSTLWNNRTITLSPDEVRLVGGPSPCSGRLEQQRQSDWEPVRDQNLDWDLKKADQVCRRISCGSVVSFRRTLDQEPPQDLVTRYDFSGTAESPRFRVKITCSDSVRLENRTDLCSGRLQVKRNQVWSSVCSDGFDQQDAEVVCRELGCGSPSGFKEELYGEAPEWIPEFRCGGHESALLHCERSDRDTCSPGTTVTLTCSDPGRVRLVGGSGRCDGTLEERKWGEWRPANTPDWDLWYANRVCRELDCGSPLSTRRRETSPKDTWRFEFGHNHKHLFDWFRYHQTSSGVIELTCSDSVRLVAENHLCSGRLEVKKNQVWSSVCSDGFDLQDAEVVCRELGCGSPSGFKEELYGEAPEWIPEFRCGGHESALLHCEHSDRDTCSPGTTVTLTCSDPDDIRLVGGANRCAGRLEMKHDGVWRAMKIQNPDWNLSLAAEICRRLDCGVAVSAVNRPENPQEDAWWVRSSRPHFPLKQYVTVNNEQTSDSLEVTCSDSVRLVGGTHRCSGRLQVKRNQVWSSVCSDGFDLQDAEVVCRELDCGSPSGFKEELYGEAPEWIPEFRCGGHESALLHCERSDRDTCSPGTTVTLTCSADMKLVGTNSTCAGELQMKVHGEWRPVANQDWDQNQNQNWTSAVAAAVCSQLGCGSVVASDVESSVVIRFVWLIKSSCVQSAVSLQDCLRPTNIYQSPQSLQVVCSDLLVQPNISVSPSHDGV
ncbi:scavenger receptor cysteine-rich type 1 protein M160-like [Acanthochromis polyacanthus]|uniref:scavenger receptor cysteine-rich type 1 protein M160-like n=1 Tax=Acanthochromis polyacanthus TaxID=80966 RepID=UPI002234799A|nr:scavenger receptor cysteine-rich type 1 protein M160-like [Acanthochromis polyacanthus]